MKKIIFYSFPIIISITILGGCKAKRVQALPPNVLFFQITKNGQTLPDSILNKISLFYFEKGGQKVEHPPANYDDKTFIFPASRHSTGLEGKGVLSSGYIDQLVYSNGANSMYLQYPDGDVDTMYVEVSNIGHEEGAKDRCYCAFPFTIVRFNGKDAPETTDIKTDDGKPIFLFEK